MNIEQSTTVFNELLLFTNKETEVCPWVRDLSFEEILREAKSEFDEVQQANNNEELSSELGDLLRDVLLAIVVAHRDKGSDSLEKVLGKILGKIKNRKPWVEKEIKVTKEEAIRIWNKIKSTEGT
ncbi:MAG: MazG nucleotide pyrophosphohydrolase domain-containing protein [Candidatus Kariarchaeaceae archaeon]|jgi:uncharacterized protein YabN with tetrapyrrole methylase and pyrophosphatase domain